MQVDLGLHCLHMPEDNFLLDAAHKSMSTPEHAVKDHGQNMMYAGRVPYLP